MTLNKARNFDSDISIYLRTAVQFGDLDAMHGRVTSEITMTFEQLHAYVTTIDSDVMSCESVVTDLYPLWKRLLTDRTRVTWSLKKMHVKCQWLPQTQYQFQDNVRVRHSDCVR